MNKTDFESLKLKLKEVKAFCNEIKIDVESDCCSPCCDISEINCLWDELNYLYRYISNVEDTIYRHMGDGHLPKVKSTEQLKRAIDVLGLSEEYKVEPITIWAANGQSDVRGVKILINKE